MNHLLCITICALTLLIKTNTLDLVPQIKVTAFQILYTNSKYIEDLSFNITKHNETYNNFGVHWIIVKDLPADVVYISKVYTTNSEHEHAKFLMEDNTPICKESPNRQLLPKPVVFDQSHLNSQCVKAGEINAKDMGNFRFEVLMPKIHEISDYHYIEYKVDIEDETVLLMTVYTENGYLKKSSNDRSIC